jgi:ABC-type iron transport system FetAB ATPase subunit
MKTLKGRVRCMKKEKEIHGNLLKKTCVYMLKDKKVEEVVVYDENLKEIENIIFVYKNNQILNVYYINHDENEYIIDDNYHKLMKEISNLKE